jgi:SNF2 family DNA or RNA helicase
MLWDVVTRKSAQAFDSEEPGGFLTDAVGLGKSLTALIASLKIKQEKRLKGFILVACPAQCVVQWCQEIHTQFVKVYTRVNG